VRKLISHDWAAGYVSPFRPTDEQRADEIMARTGACMSGGSKQKSGRVGGGFSCVCARGTCVLTEREREREREREKRERARSRVHIQGEREERERARERERDREMDTCPCTQAPRATPTYLAPTPTPSLKTIAIA